MTFMALSVERFYGLESSQVLVAPIVGAISYLLFLFLERKGHSTVLFFVALLSLFGLLLPVNGYSSMSKFEHVLVFSLVETIPCLLGSSYHQKLGGAAKTRSYSFLLLFGSGLLSFLVGSIPYNVSDLTYGFRLEHVYPFSLIAYPAMTSFLFWVWQNMKQRPGVDKHLNS